MIRLMLGNVGSGKTASMVREMVLDNSERTTFSNIITKKISNNKVIDASMIINKTIDDKGKVSLSLNKNFWQELRKKNICINVIIDEAHTILNPRRAMSKINIIVTDWMALLRRVLGSSDAGYGELTLITQLDRRIDPIAREMATSVYFHVCHYMKTCKDCGYTVRENNESANQLNQCPSCGSFKIKKHSHIVEVWRFRNIRSYEVWRESGKKTYHNHYFIRDIEKYFPYYNTLQWENLISEY